MLWTCCTDYLGGYVIDLIPDKITPEPPPLEPQVAEQLISRLEYCDRFSAHISARQCLINQAQGKVDPFSPYGPCPACPDRVVGRLPRVPRTVDGAGLPWPSRFDDGHQGPKTGPERMKRKKLKGRREGVDYVKQVTFDLAVEDVAHKHSAKKIIRRPRASANCRPKEAGSCPRHGLPATRMGNMVACRRCLSEWGARGAAKRWLGSSLEGCVS